MDNDITQNIDVIFRVDDNSDLPIWVQLRNRMAYLIRTGYFPEGTQLPSVRTLSSEAQINYNTVTKAYADLEADGLIVNVRGRGMFIKRGTSSERDTSLDGIDALFEDCIQQYRLAGMNFRDITAHVGSILEKEEAKVVIHNQEYPGV